MQPFLGNFWVLETEEIIRLVAEKFFNFCHNIILFLIFKLVAFNNIPRI